MIVLDTNVISELTRNEPHPSVLAWFSGLDDIEPRITAVTAAELLYGVSKMPGGKRRFTLAMQIARMLDLDFAGKILAFDYEAAVIYADIVSRRDRIGNPISSFDAMIAATALSGGASHLVTRNIKDFRDTGIELVDPWEN